MKKIEIDIHKKLHDFFGFKKFKGTTANDPHAVGLPGCGDFFGTAAPLLKLNPRM